MKQLELTLTESEAKIVLEALLKRESDMSDLCRTSDDEDLVADTGNDLIELRLLLKPLRERALATFGSNVLNFSRDEL
jgi:hypothetical protein